jgi:hypothetical protein
MPFPELLAQWKALLTSLLRPLPDTGACRGEPVRADRFRADRLRAHLELAPELPCVNGCTGEVLDLGLGSFNTLQSMPPPSVRLSVPPTQAAQLV